MKKRLLAVLLAAVMTATLLPTVALAADSDFIIDADGVLTKYKGSGGEVAIPEGVTAIGDRAFYDCFGLEKVTIPSSVDSIGNWAFADCYNLTDVVFSEGVTSIGACAFSECYDLTNVNLPQSLTSIGSSAFEGCHELTDLAIPDSVTEIGPEAFRNCARLRSIDIPAGVVGLSSNMFWGCVELEYIWVSLDHPKYTSVNGVVFSKDKTVLEIYPCGKEARFGYTFPDGVTAIGDYAFWGCGGLGDGITIPDGVTSIGYAAFMNSDLRHVTIPASVSFIWARAFANCGTLMKITVEPNNVGSYYSENGVLFRDYKGRTELVAYPAGRNGRYSIPDGVNKIWECAFFGCEGLRDIFIPESVTEIGYGAFGCCGLASITIPESVKTFGHYLFEGSDRLNKVVLPDNLTCVGEGMFRGCIRLNAIVLPDSVTEIQNYAFGDCEGLTQVVIPASVTSIGADVLEGCPNLTVYGQAGSEAEKYCNENNIPFSSQEPPALPEELGVESLDYSIYGPSITSLPSDCKAYIKGLKDESVVGFLTIPDKISDGDYEYDVAAISGWFAFEDCVGLTGVSIPGSVSSVEMGAFRGCTGLKKLVIREGTTHIGSDALRGDAFGGCTSLTDITLPESLTTISGGFSGCSALTSVVIPKTVISMTGGFENCPNLTIYGYTGSEAERYCAEKGIRFSSIDNGFLPGSARLGALESSDGERVPWEITAEGQIIVDADQLTTRETVLAACYDSDGRFSGVKLLDANSPEAQIDPATPNVKLFWLGANQNPLSPSATVWGK